jgi:hypothetical protein
MKRRRALAGLAVAVLAAVVTLVVVARAPASRPARRSGPAAARPSAGGDDGAVAPAGAPRGTPRPAPALPGATPGGAADPVVGDDGAVVRDHRAGPAVPPPPRKLTHQTVADLRADVRSMVKDCARPIRARDHTLRGTLGVRLHLVVAAGRARIDTVDLHLAGLVDETFLDCARTALTGAELPVPDGQADAEATTLELSLAVP